MFRGIIKKLMKFFILISFIGVPVWGLYIYKSNEIKKFLPSKAKIALVSPRNIYFLDLKNNSCSIVVTGKKEKKEFLIIPREAIFEADIDQDGKKWVVE
jgi:hypothetical protein